jgi:hypothetical protein
VRGRPLLRRGRRGVHALRDWLLLRRGRRALHRVPARRHGHADRQLVSRLMHRLRAGLRRRCDEPWHSGRRRLRRVPSWLLLGRWRRELLAVRGGQLRLHRRHIALVELILQRAGASGDDDLAA